MSPAPRLAARLGPAAASRARTRAIHVVMAALVMSGLVGGAVAAAPGSARAADPELTVVGQTSYEAQPDQGRIHVTSNLTIANHARNTATRTYFYDQAFLAVPPEATSFTVSGGFGRSNWTISERKPTYTLLSLTFGGRLNAGATTKLQLTFELPDPGDPPSRELRVSRTLITFPVWALASTGTAGSTVTVSVPAGYAVTFLRGSIPGPTTDAAGNQVWASGPIPDPLKFDLYVRADRPLQYVETPHTVTVGSATASLTFRAWIDDAAWLQRMEDLYDGGLPRLASAIGRPWPVRESLIVEEALNAPTEGIAGAFDPSSHTIQVIYDAGPEIALHEAAHLWFNGGLLADRWANEGFAAYYAEQVAEAMGLPVEPAVITPQLQAVAVPLNAWAAGDAAPATGAELSAVEAYGYAASAELARKIAQAVGPAGLQRVWTSIATGVAPYQPPDGPVEPLTAAPDWRGLLDLLEDDGTAHLAGLWATDVVTADQASMLANRTVARRAYADALARANGWSLPRSIRDAMRAWQFDVAAQQLSLVSSVFDARDSLASATATAGLPMPATLARQFTDAADLSTFASLVKAEGQAVTAIEAARAARPSDVGPVEWIGLLGTRPDQSLEGALAAFESGDPAKAMADAADAQASWHGAGEAGRVRAIVGVVVLAIILAAVVVLGIRRRARVARD